MAGRAPCETLLAPPAGDFWAHRATAWLRAPAVHQFGNGRGFSYASNANDRARHIWDRPDGRGVRGVMVTVVVPWLFDHRINQWNVGACVCLGIWKSVLKVSRGRRRDRPVPAADPRVDEISADRGSI